MNKPIRIALAITGGVLLIALLAGVGLSAAQAYGLISLGPAQGMMGWFYGGRNPGSSMMGNGAGMMWGYGSGSAANVKPLTVDQAWQAVESYLKALNNPDLELKEIMVFDNNAYARITEKSSGIGAMELLVDPATLAVFPEYGPDMMWNLKYSPMSANGANGTYRGMMGPRGGMMGGYGGMMRGYNANPGPVSATMTITAEQAVKIAQQYLDQQFPGYQADPEPDPFYGYYTIDILKDGQPAGMLSVNGFSGQIFLHTWHGNFVAASE